MEADTQIGAGIVSSLLRVSARSCLSRRLSVISQVSPRVCRAPVSLSLMNFPSPKFSPSLCLVLSDTKKYIFLRTPTLSNPNYEESELDD